MWQPPHAKDRVAAYFRKGVGAAAKGTRWWDSIFWPNRMLLWNATEKTTTVGRHWNGNLGDKD